MRHLVITGIAGLLLSASAQAIDAPSRYSIETEVISFDEEIGLSFDFFFTPIQNDSNPYAVQPFVQRASRIGIDLGHVDIDFDAPIVFGLDDSPIFIPIVYTLPALDRRLQIRADLYDVTEKSGDLEWQVGIGCYVTDNFRVGVDVIGDFFSSDVEVSLDFVDFEYYMADHKLDLRLIVYTEEVGDYFKIGASYYPTKELGLNLDVHAGDFDSVFEVGADYVVGPVVLGATYVTELEELKLNAKIRF